MQSVTYIKTADIHMSNSLPYAKVVTHGNGVTDRLQMQLKLWPLMRAKAIKYKAEGVIIDGDLFDKATLDPVTLTETFQAIEELAKYVRVFVVPGNHDAASVRGGRFNVEALGSIPGVTVLSRPGLTDIGPKWLNIYACPFAPIEQNRKSVQAMRKSLNSKRHNVLLYHNGVVGCRHLAWVCDDGMAADELTKGWDDVIAGHFHSRQKFGSCGRYLGAPMQHSFSDVGERRGIYAVKFTKGESTKFTFIPSGQPEFHLVDSGWKMEDAPEARKGDYIRFEIEATSADWKVIEPEVTETVQKLRDSGIHAMYMRKPVYHHTVRGASANAMEGMSGAERIGRYVDSPEVVIGDLDPSVLKELGRELHNEAKADER